MARHVSGGSATASWCAPGAGPTVARASREWAAEVLASWDVHELLDDVALVMSELVTNAIKYGGGLRSVAMSMGRGHLVISVTDWGGSDEDEAAQECRDPDGGRGLTIVTALTSTWYVKAGEDVGKTICAVIALAPFASPASGELPLPYASGRRAVAM
jgi:anti-sigma regulatory factor (Ser/Thr protein kinase)